VLAEWDANGDRSARGVGRELRTSCKEG
jgi:hypothetical protein